MSAKTSAEVVIDGKVYTLSGYEGEEYLENNGGDLVHLECIQGIKWLIDWLGYEIKEFGGK